MIAIVPAIATSAVDAMIQMLTERFGFSASATPVAGAAFSGTY
jgi:hypothetical protein